MTSKPKFIALCGPSEGGKSTAQTFLADVFGVIPIDDGRPLRDAAKALYGVTEEQVTTAAGKRESVEICGRLVVVRDLLGGLAEDHEKKYGEQYLSWAAMRHATLAHPNHAGAFSLGSVRRNQNRYYAEAGGHVIQIDPVNFPATQAVANHSFDWWNKDFVHSTVPNLWGHPAVMKKALFLLMTGLGHEPITPFAVPE